MNTTRRGFFRWVAGALFGATVAPIVAAESPAERVVSLSAKFGDLPIVVNPWLTDPDCWWVSPEREIHVSQPLFEKVKHYAN